MSLELPTEISQSALQNNVNMLAENEYPGRWLAVGVAQTGKVALQAYALSGRSEGSRNRIFVNDGLGIRTVAPDKTPEEMAEVEMANLIYYRAMQDRGGVHIVSNGAQTEPIQWDMLKHGDLVKAMKDAPTVDGVDLSNYEPDDPNWTPRITGALILRPRFGQSAQLSVGRVYRADERTSHTSSRGLIIAQVPDGVGYAIQTYAGNGDPLPSYIDEPYPFPMLENAQDTAEMVWESFNKDNRVAVVVKEIDINSGETEDYHIIDRRNQS